MKKSLIICALVASLIFALACPAAAISQTDISGGAPSGITACEDGGFLITDVFNKVIWKVSEDGTVTNCAGKISAADITGEPVGIIVDAKAAEARFMNPWAIAPFMNGYAISEPDGNVVRYFGGDSVMTAAGSGKAGSKNAVGTLASFSRPTGLATGDDGVLYIADTDNGSIRSLNTDGKVSTVITGLSEPTGLFWHSGALYVAETGAHRISKIENGVRSIVVGFGSEEGYTDGLVNAAKLRSPQGVAVGEDGTIYIADTGNGAIRKLSGGVVSTLMRTDDNGGPVLPRSILVSENMLLVTDTFARTVFEISLEKEKFSDVVDGAWYENGVYEAVERGLFTGMGEGLFAPNASTNRAMLAMMITNLQNQLDADVVIAGSAAISDASEGAWYLDSATWTVDLGILSLDGGNFFPTKEITREEMTVALWRFANYLGAGTSADADLSLFKDAGKINSDALEAMEWAVASKLIYGVGDDMLSPDTTTTRAQMAQVMIRFMNLLQS